MVEGSGRKSHTPEPVEILPPVNRSSPSPHTSHETSTASPHGPNIHPHLGMGSCPARTRASLGVTSSNHSHRHQEKINVDMFPPQNGSISGSELTFETLSSRPATPFGTANILLTTGPGMMPNNTMAQADCAGTLGSSGNPAYRWQASASLIYSASNQENFWSADTTATSQIDTVVEESPGELRYPDLWGHLPYVGDESLVLLSPDYHQRALAYHSRIFQRRD
jgi:hypothetical protein